MEGVNEIFGGAGDDLILAGDGTRVDGGAGDDEIFSAFPNADDAHDDGVTFVDGGLGNDLVSLDDGDVAAGGAGADVFEVWDAFDPEDPVVLQDFDAAEDLLILLSETGTAEPDQLDGSDVRVQPSGSGQETEVFYDGHLVVILEGVTPEELGPPAQWIVNVPAQQSAPA
ncbi:MAG: hypothetical protein HRU30_07740 [Rhodobacteraceae bacterium]|nr:hypothetical protein [Paracoccaceae bacterium]